MNKNMPAVAGGDGALEPVVIDLDEAAEFSAVSRKENVTAMCTYCGDTIRQEDVFCKGCGAVAVWKHSTIWRKLYGNPTTFLRKLQNANLAPKTPLEVAAVYAFGTDGAFSHETQMNTFRSLANKYPEGFIRELVEWAKKKHVSFQAFESAVKNSANAKRWEAEQAKREEDTKQDDTKDNDPDEGWGDPWGKGTQD